MAEHSIAATAFVAGFTLVAAAFDLAQSRRLLWTDEASTYWTIHVSAFDLLRGARTDGTPPLYFLIDSAAIHVLGSSELVLRLPSLIAAIALVPAIYAVTRLVTTQRAAVIAAGVTAISPLVHYYSVEARNYSLVELETLAIVYFAYRAILTPQRLRCWAWLVLAETIQLWTHNYALFVLPVPTLVCLLVGGRARITLAVKAASASLLAFILYLPCFFRAVESAQTGIGDWLGPPWEATPPSAAVLRSLEVFAFGGLYPSYLSYLGQAPAVRILAVPISLGLLAIAVLPWSERRLGNQTRSANYMLLGFLFIPLLGAWLYSWLRSPVYMVGRYDTVVLPVFLILFASGLDKILRAHPWVGRAVAAVVVGLAAVSSATTFDAPFTGEPENIMAARTLAHEAAPGDPIVSTGLRRPLVDYYLDRAGHHAEIVSFPFEMGEHPAWASPARMLQDRDRLLSDSARLLESLTEAAKQGHAIWILASGQNEVDNYLYRPLFQRLALDNARTQRQWSLYCFVK